MSVIVPVPVPVCTVAFSGPLNTTVNLSVDSCSVSSVVRTVTVLAVVPAVNVSVPLDRV